MQSGSRMDPARSEHWWGRGPWGRLGLVVLIDQQCSKGHGNIATRRVQGHYYCGNGDRLLPNLN